MAEKRQIIGDDFIRRMERRIADPMTNIRESALKGLTANERAVALDLESEVGDDWHLLTQSQRRNALNSLCERHGIGQHKGEKYLVHHAIIGKIVNATAALVNMDSSDQLLQRGRSRRYRAPYRQEPRTTSVSTIEKRLKVDVE